MTTNELPQANERALQRKRAWSRRLRRGAFVAACLATLIGLFYAEENWRGKRAWDRTRLELETKGACLNWAAYVPRPVPDEQNIFKAPNMQDWFVKGGSNEAGRRLWENSAALKLRQTSAGESVVVAELKLVPPGNSPGPETPDARLRPRDPGARDQLGILLRDAVGQALIGAQDITLLGRAPEQIKPLQLMVEAKGALGLGEVKALLPDASALAPGSALKAEVTGTNTFRLLMNLPPSWCAAADYLAWSDQFEPDVAAIREALKRPYARMEGDYQRAFAGPVPSYVAIRRVAQRLAQRAQCHLLLGHPEPAARELALLRELCRLLEASPSGKPMTLVSAMINVAVTGLYTRVISDGLRLEVWREAELAVLQQQAGAIRLLPYVVGACEAERAGVCQLLETLRTRDLCEVFSFGTANASVWRRLTDPTRVLLTLAPRGWVYQNMALVASLEQKAIEGMDPTNGIVFPRQVDRVSLENQAAFSRFSPYTFLAAAAVPNIAKASRTAARNQALATAASVACGLKRYRLAKGQYPATLEELVPQFASAVARDVIGGQTLKYRSTPAGGYLLYSVGWNEGDDGGVPSDWATEGDWVWDTGGAR